MERFFSGGLLLMTIGYLAMQLRPLLGWAQQRVRLRLLTSIEVPDSDPAFDWLCHWLADAQAERCRGEFTLGSRLLEAGDDPDCVGRPPAAAKSPSSHRRRWWSVLSPAPGVHYLRVRGRMVVIYRERREKEWSNKGYVESLRLLMMGDGRRILEDILAEARKLARVDDDQRITIWTPCADSWAAAGSMEPRAQESVVLADNLWDELLVDIDRFQTSREWYRQRGVPHRRGYLLHGPPGSGKSSLVAALASVVGCDVYILNLASGLVSDTALPRLLASVPSRSLVLIEDIDCVQSTGERAPEAPARRRGPTGANDKRRENVSLATLLNAIDGVGASEGRVLVMTSNFPDVLDQALVRPGRCDRHFYLGPPTAGQARELFRRFFGDAGTAEQAGAFASLVHGDASLSMAALQEVLLANRDDPEGATTALAGLVTRPAEQPVIAR